MRPLMLSTAVVLTAAMSSVASFLSIKPYVETPQGPMVNW